MWRNWIYPFFSTFCLSLLYKRIRYKFIVNTIFNLYFSLLYRFDIFEEIDLVSRKAVFVDIAAG